MWIVMSSGRAGALPSKFNSNNERKNDQDGDRDQRQAQETIRRSSRTMRRGESTMKLWQARFVAECGRC